MIPLRDLNPTERRPYVTWGILALCAAVFAYELWLPADAAGSLLERFGVVPSVLSGEELSRARSAGGALGALVTPFSAIFLHADVGHLIGNLWFLHIFGDNVEDAVGRLRYLAFVLFAAAAAALAQVAVDPTSGVPMIGASGAISGVLAAYVVLYPRAPVLTIVPLPLAFFVEIPAFAFIFVWFGFQLVRGFDFFESLGPGGSGVAWWAHIGGFAAGLVWAGIRAIRASGSRRRSVAKR